MIENVHERDVRGGAAAVGHPGQASAVDKAASVRRLRGRPTQAAVTTSGPQRRLVRKVVCYVVHDGRLLVFTHDDVPMEVTGVQVPAGTIEVAETPDEAAVREVHEETGLRAEITRALGVERYDMWPAKPEVHERHFFQLHLGEVPVPERWQAGEDDSSDGGARVRWTCWWLPLSTAHVLCAGLGARLGELAADVERS